MSSITSLDDLVSLTTGGGSAAPQFIHKFWNGGSKATPVASRWTSLLEYPSTLGHYSTTPGAAAIPTNTLAGSFLQTDPGGGRELWLTGGVVNMSQLGLLMIYDRLMHCSGLSGTSTGAQTVQGSPASPALTRYTDGVGNIAFAEIYTQIGATATTLTIDYTDQDGNTGHTSTAVSIGGTGLREGQRMIPIALAAGDTGVRAINTTTLAASTTTAGNWGITIAHPLAYMIVPSANVPAVIDLLTTGQGFPEVQTDACVCAAFLCATTTTLTGFASLAIHEK